MINRKINYFLTLAECLSFTQTAARYDISQTAVSQYIASLEDRLGVRLFERSQRTVILTEAGRYYYDQVRHILREYDQTLEQLKSLDAGYHGHLKVGVGMYEYCSTENFFSAFLSAHPEIQVDILQFAYSTLTAKLRTGDLDVIIADVLCENDFSHRELQSMTLFRSPNYLVMSDAVAARYSPNDITEIVRKECLITNCESSGPSSISMLENLLKDEFGFVPERISQTNSVDAQLMLVRAGRGIAIVPGFVVNVQKEGLQIFPLPQKKEVSYNLISMKDSPNEAVSKIFEFSEERSRISAQPGSMAQHSVP